MDQPSEISTSLPLASPPVYSSPPASPKRSKKTPLIVAGSVLIILLIAGGSLAYMSGWLPFGRSLSPDEVLDRMLANVLDINSASYDIKLAFKSEPRTADATPWAADLPQFQARMQAIKRDRQRLSNLPAIQQSIRKYYNKNKIDPPSLDQLSTPDTYINQPSLLDPQTQQLYGYRQEAGGQNYTLHIQLETDAAIEAYQKTLADQEKGSPIIRDSRTIEITKDSPIIYASVNFSDVSPYPIASNFNEFYQYLPIEIDAFVQLSGQNESEISQTNDGAYNLSGQLALGGATFNGAAELRKKGEDYYLNIQQAPSLGFFDLAALKQKWIKAVPRDAYNTWLGSLLYRSRDESIDKRGALLLRQYQLILQLLQQEEVLQIVQEFPREKADGRNLYHYQVKMDRDKFANFYRRLTQAVEQEFGDQAIIKFDEETQRYLDSDEFSQFYDTLDKNITLELWVDDQNFWPRKFAYTVRLVPPDTVPKLQDIQYRFTLTAGLDDINQPISIETPVDSITVDQAQVLLTGKSLEQVRLSRQQSQLRAIRNALQAYYIHTGNYPEDLTRLLKKVSQIPARQDDDQPENKFSSGSYELKRLQKKDDPFLQVIPQDIFTNQPYNYTSTNDSYQLKYTVQMPPKREDDISDYRYDFNQRLFVPGINTATADNLSIEASQNLPSPSTESLPKHP